MTGERAVPLDQNELFRFVGAPQLGDCTSALVQRGYGANEIIFEAGEAADACYLIESGAVRISTPGAGEHETLALLGPGEFFGELGLYDRAPRSARATTVMETRVGVLDAAAFDRLQALAPLAIVSALAEANMQRVRATNRTLVDGLASAGRLREIGSELGTIAHNLRSPLATMVNAAALLRELLSAGRPPAEQISKFAEIIHRTGTGALHSMDELLGQLRGESEIEWRTTDANEVAAAVEEQVRGLASAGGVELRMEVETTVPIRAQAGELTGALVNLVRNAIEALPPEGGSVTLGAREEGGELIFSVADTGGGIPPEYRGHIFEPRFTRGKTGGTGLGLPHVKRVAERHGGRVELVDSPPGSGTTFLLILPLSRGMD